MLNVGCNLVSCHFSLFRELRDSRDFPDQAVHSAEQGKGGEAKSTTTRANRDENIKVERGPRVRSLQKW